MLSAHNITKGKIFTLLKKACRSFLNISVSTENIPLGYAKHQNSVRYSRVKVASEQKFKKLKFQSLRNKALDECLQQKQVSYRREEDSNKFSARIINSTFFLEQLSFSTYSKSVIPGISRKLCQRALIYTIWSKQVLCKHSYIR